MKKARYIMIGGFLGAGKSTAILQMAQTLAKDHTLGLITNDQGASLVDTTNLVSKGFQVEEIAGGCFCCRFNSLMEAAQNLEKQSAPDVFIAEPVGSCTDLIATVSYPLRRIYGNQFTISPLSVVVDPIRAMRILDLEDGKKFSPKVEYIYLKQLEEADIIVINKTDLLDLDKEQKLEDALQKKFPCAKIIRCSARENKGIREWLDIVMDSELGTATPMEVDYKVYAEGEALLGWLNCSAKIESKEPFDGNLFVKNIAANLQSILEKQEIEIAHLKMTLSPQNQSQIAVINLVRNGYVPELAQNLLDQVETGELIINLRAEGNADFLNESIEKALKDCSSDSIKITVDHKEFFQPSEPVPTYREPAV